MITPSGPGKRQASLQAMAGIGGSLLLATALGLHHWLDISYTQLAVIVVIAVLASVATSGLVAQASAAEAEEASDAHYQMIRALLVITSAIISMTAILLMLR